MKYFGMLRHYNETFPFSRISVKGFRRYIARLNISSKSKLGSMLRRFVSALWARSSN